MSKIVFSLLITIFGNHILKSTNFSQNLKYKTGFHYFVRISEKKMTESGTMSP